MGVIALAVLALVDGIVTPGMATVSAADAVFASTVANRASPFASARPIVIVTMIGDVIAMATGATGDSGRRSGRHPAPSSKQTRWREAFPRAGRSSRLDKTRPNPLPAYAVMFDELAKSRIGPT